MLKINKKCLSRCLSLSKLSFFLNQSLAFHGKLSEPWKGPYLRSRMLKMAKPGGDMLEKSRKPFLEAQESIGSEGLHEALCRGFPESVSEGGPIVIPF